jgi:hypothetical protein
MNKAEFAQLIDAYADAKASGNKYLVQRMIADLEQALNELFVETPDQVSSEEE